MFICQVKKSVESKARVEAACLVRKVLYAAATATTATAAATAAAPSQLQKTNCHFLNVAAAAPQLAVKTITGSDIILIVTATKT